MRVVLNQHVALGQKTGIGHYASELMRCLRAQAGADEVESFPEGWVRRARQWAAQARHYLEARRKDPLPGQELAPSRRAADRRRAVGWMRQPGHRLLTYYFQHTCRRRCYDLYHEPNLIPLPSDVPTVATLHDLSVLLHPEWHPADRVAHYERHFRPALEHCIHFLTGSDFTRQELIQTLNLPPAKVTRTYHGIRPGLRPMTAEETAPVLRQLGLPPHYLLYLGTIEPRKNVKLLLQAYCDLPDRLRSNWPLLLAGSWGWNTAEVAEFYHTEARHRGVRHLGYVADEHLAALYNGARVLVFPSYYEGFGLPPVEMLACGGAVLASKAGAVVETVGKKACLIDADDRPGWRTAIARILTEDDWWQHLRHGAREVARAFTWERCAADTWNVYRSLVRPVSGCYPEASMPPRRAAG